MTLNTDLTAAVQTIFQSVWSQRDGTVVPEPENLRLGNDAVNLQATVLYADLAESTALVDGHTAVFAAEVYKSYLHCAAKIIKSQGGSITAYDGDRVMAVYIGDMKNSRAVKSALMIHYAVLEIINPLLARQYPKESYRVKQAVGIDTSPILASRIGVRNDNDLVWVGRAANYAAKLCGIRSDYPTYITGNVFDVIEDAMKVTGGKSMWEERVWTDVNNLRIYRSNWFWRF